MCVVWQRKGPPLRGGARSRTRKAHRSTGFQPGPVAGTAAKRWSGWPFRSFLPAPRPGLEVRNLSLEARDDCPFHHRGNNPAHSGGQGSRTLISTRENRVSSAARQPVIRLPSEITHQWTDRELKCGSPDCQPGVFPLDHQPMFIEWTAGDSNPGTAAKRWSPGCKPSVFALDQRPLYQEVRPGVEPGLLPYRGSVPPRTPTDHRVIPDGLEPSLSWLSPRRLRLWTTGSSSDRDRSRTCKVTRLSTSPLFLFAYPVVAGPGVAPGGPGL